MTTIPFYTPTTEFANGDLLSATRLNQMLTNIDAVYGLERRGVFGITYGRTRNETGGLGAYEWRGWVAFRGNQLKIYVTEACIVEFDVTGKHNAFSTSFGAAGLQIIPLPARLGYTEHECYCIRVQNATPPLYAYMDKSDAAAILTQPTYPDGTIPNEDTFNLTRSSTERLAEQFNQPIVCGSSWSSGPTIPSWLNDQDLYSIEFYAEYRHPCFEYYATATPGDTGSVDTIAWEVTGNTGGPYQFDAVSIPGPGALTMTEPRNVALPASNLTVGNWYKFKFLHNNNDGDGTSVLYWWGQTPATAEASWTPQTRWSMGGVVHGNTGAPQLVTMSANLTYLDTRRNNTNPVMRQSTQRRDAGESENPYRIERVFARRVHRWLAYENADTEATPTLLYTTERLNVFASVTMDTSYTTAYFDLDQSPIKPGMVFYVLNCNYAIQVSDHP